MIFRIDIQHFLSHMIDYFTREELIHFQYAIISAKIPNQGRCSNVVKVNNLYPDVDTITAYADYKDRDIAEKMYFEMLKNDESEYKSKHERSWADYVFYNTFIQPLSKHFDVVIVCDKEENIWVDFLCKYLKKTFSIEVIDLNVLFSKGEIGPIYIDRDEIFDKAADVKRSAAMRAKESLESSRDGRLKLIQMMTKNEKIKKLKELGIRVSPSDMKNLDSLLIDSWVDELNDSYDTSYNLSLSPEEYYHP